MIHSATFRQNTPQLFSTGTETKFWGQVGIYCLKFAGQHRFLLIKPTISIINHLYPNESTLYFYAR